MINLMTNDEFAKAFAKSVDSYVGVKTAVTPAFEHLSWYSGWTTGEKALFSTTTTPLMFR